MEGKIIILAGPTASGKTALASELIKRYPLEIISADSRQVYKGLDIGTGKDKSVPQHMIDVIDPHRMSSLRGLGSGRNGREDGMDSRLRGNDKKNKRVADGCFSVSRYQQMTLPIMDQIRSRGNIPLIVGGTGYYIDSLVFQRSTNDTLPNLKLRQELEYITNDELVSEIKRRDPRFFATVDRQNRKRLIRAVEILRATNAPIRPLQRQIRPNLGVSWYVLDVPREELYQRIDKRVDERIDQEMIEEVENLLKSGVSADWLLSLGLEYYWITRYLLSSQPPLPVISTSRDRERRNPASFDPDGISLLRQAQDRDDITREEMIQRLKFAIHAYARRQITYFKRWPDAKWYDLESINEDIGRELQLLSSSRYD